MKVRAMMITFRQNETVMRRLWNVYSHLLSFASTRIFDVGAIPKSVVGAISNYAKKRDRVKRPKKYYDSTKSTEMAVCFILSHTESRLGNGPRYYYLFRLRRFIVHTLVLKFRLKKSISLKYFVHILRQHSRHVSPNQRRRRRYGVQLDKLRSTVWRILRSSNCLNGN